MAIVTPHQQVEAAKASSDFVPGTLVVSKNHTEYCIIAITSEGNVAISLKSGHCIRDALFFRLSENSKLTVENSLF